MAFDPPLFRRPALAVRMAEQILSTQVGSAAPSGLFLAAPRRTGKSTFLREDLRPALEAAGAMVLYADLWADKAADTGDVIVAVVREAFGSQEGLVRQAARKLGLKSIEVGGGALSFDLSSIGVGAQVSLSQALAELSDTIRRPIVLIIDEAQHAITSDRGYDAMAALKAARDELNSSRHHGLRVVATGSNRDKLAMLRNSRDQAFYGAPLVKFPPLDRGFVQWFCEGVNLPAPLDVDTVWGLFQQSGYRPEILGAAADDVRFDFEIEAPQVPERFAAAVAERIASADEQVLRVVHSLTPLQSAVLRVMAHRGEAYAPFEAETMAAYATVLKGEKVETSGVQQALSALQEKALVWRERRGVYALEESSLADLMRAAGMLEEVPPIRQGSLDGDR